MTTTKLATTPEQLPTLSEADLVGRIEEAGRKSDFHYQHAVAFAILQGVYLAHAKETVAHGNFKKWIKEKLPGIHYTTANRNRKLALAIRDQIKSSARATFGPNDIMSLPVLKGDKRSKVLEAIEKIEAITEGRSLRRLCFDFEVCNRPDPRGGKRTPAEPSRELTEEERLLAIQEEWQTLIGELYEGWEKKSWAFLPKTEREILLGTMEPFVKDLRKSLR